LGNQANSLRSKYPESSFANLTIPYNQWHYESFEVATKFVYEGITENTLPSAEYIATTKVVAEQ